MPAPARKVRKAPPAEIDDREAERRGLYGSSLGGNMMRTATAEAVGTFLLVVVGTSVATTSILQPSFYTAGFVALAFGLVLTALVAGLGHISGCHVNPAVTLGLAVTRQFPWRYVPAYLVAQLGGALLASLVVWAEYGERARTGAAHLGAVAPNRGVSAGQAFLVEAVITFLLVFVVCSVATDDRVPSAVAPQAVGFALAAAVYVGVSVTGGAVNPARAFGPSIISGFYRLPLVYLFAPLVGGVLGALTYDRFIKRASTPST